MEDYQKVGYSKEVIEFVAVAKEYCEFIERSLEQDVVNLINGMQKFLPLIYLKGSLLPSSEVEVEGLLEDYVTEQEYNYLLSGIFRVIGGQYDEYLDVFDDAMQYSEEPIVQSISEKLCDIYQDLKNFISAFRCGIPDVMEEALWNLNNNFERYWGKSTVSVLRAVHAVSFQLLDKED